ncbi:diguanylate cyclase [Hydrogenimonas urashimensis]|uniref:diguanylate cyclase n=1 Tax=Hydrogenimonas urashimensis TaxID=2740515 RepID=UPI001914EB5E|nr:diguanylate cyclase [Hydrogenimonas urashimensis]
MKEKQKLPIRIVYIEDDETIRGRIGALLQEHIDIVRIAKSGKEGLELFRNFDADAIVTDFSLPEMDGLEFIEKIKKAKPRCPIFLTVTIDDIPFVTDAVKKGVTHYLFKESPPEKLLRPIRESFNFFDETIYSLKISSDARIEDIGTSFADYLGYSREELLALPLSSIILSPKGTRRSETFPFLSHLKRFGRVESCHGVFRKREGGTTILSGFGKQIANGEAETYMTEWYPVESLLQAHRQTKKQLKKESYLKSLMRFHTDISHEAMRSGDFETFLQRILDRIPAIDANIQGCLFVKEKGLELVFHTHDLPKETLRLLKGVTDHGKDGEASRQLPCYLAAKHRKTVFLDDLSQLAESSFKRTFIDNAIHSLVSIPLQDMTLSSENILTLMFKQPHFFEKEELELWEKIAETLSFALDSIRTRMERDRLIQKLDTMAHTDNLTGTVNRHRGMELLEAEIDRARRYGKRFSILFFDIDNFKKINDTYGHAMGDKVLTQTSRSIKSSLRSTDTLIRWGGEEFLILLPETALGDAVHLAQKLRQCIEQRNGDIPLPVTASFGATEWIPGESFDTLISRADAKMYEAKRQGRNRICY